MAELRRRLALLGGDAVVLLVVVVVANSIATPGYLTLQNQVNLLTLSIEKAIVVLAMAFVIIGGEIDLSVASVMGLSAILFAWLAQGIGAGAGHPRGADGGGPVRAQQRVLGGDRGLPSLVVTLAGLIMYRGLSRDAHRELATRRPAGLVHLARSGPFLGPLPFAIVLFVVLLVVAAVVLHRSGFGRYTYVIGNSTDVARFSGVRVDRVKFPWFITAGIVAAVAGLLLAARFGSLRGNHGEGFELDIITMVLFGGVSIFGGRGTMVGVILSIFVILNVRNGLALLGVSGNTQTAVIGALLILSVLVPNLAGDVRRRIDAPIAPRGGLRRLLSSPGPAT